MTSLATYQPVQYYLPMAKTKAIGFDSLFKQRRTYRRYLAVFLRPYHAVARLLGAGYGGEGLGPAGFLCCQSVNPAIYPPTPIDSGARSQQINKGGHGMAHTSILAHPEQTQSPVTYHLAARAARKAARQWFAGIPTQTLVAWRDAACNQHCSHLPNPTERSKAFNEAFALEVGRLIIGGGHE